MGGSGNLVAAAVNKARQDTARREHVVTIRFPHVDPAGIVFYPRYFELLAGSFPDLPLSDPPFAFSLEFRKPNRLGDRVRLVFDRTSKPKDDDKDNNDTADWYVAGKMNDAEHFRLAPIAPDALSADVQRIAQSSFAAAASTIGDWSLDRTGRLHLSRYFELLNMSIEEWFEDTLDMPFHELHIGRKIGIPTVRFRTHCRRLPASGDTVTVFIRAGRIGNRSMTFTSWLVRDGECLLETEQVIVFVRMQEQAYQSISIPAYIRDAFASRAGCGED